MIPVNAPFFFLLTISNLNSYQNKSLKKNRLVQKLFRYRGISRFLVPLGLNLFNIKLSIRVIINSNYSN